MTFLQTATVGVAAILAFLIGVVDFNLLQALFSAILWLIFSALGHSSIAWPRSHAKHKFALSELTDDELPNYTIVVALYREASIVEDLVAAIDAIDYPKAKLDIKLVVERRDFETLSRIVEFRLPAATRSLLLRRENPRRNRARSISPYLAHVEI